MHHDHSCFYTVHLYLEWHVKRLVSETVVENFYLAKLWLLFCLTQL